MRVADARAVLAAGAVLAVALFGETAYPLVYVLAGAVLTIAAMSLATGGPFRWTLEEKAGAALIGWSVLAAAAASGSLLASKVTVASWAAAWLIWVVVLRGERSGRELVAFLVLVGAALAASGLVFEFIGLLKPRVGGLSVNPNISAALILPAAPIALMTLRRRWLAWTLFLGLAATILVTGSRAGLIAVVVMVALSVPRSRLRTVFLLVGAVAVAAALSWRLLVNPEPLAWHRWQIWRAVGELIRANPLWGIGAGDLGEATGPYRLAHTVGLGVWGHVIGSAESTLLGLAARIGLPGLLLGMGWAGVWWSRLRHRLPFAMASFAVLCVFGLVHDVLSEPAVLWWWAMILGVLAPRRPFEEGSTPVRPAALRFALAAAAGGIAAWALVQPPAAALMAASKPPTPDLVRRVVRLEPWMAEAMEWRLADLLQKSRWQWWDASEALDWSQRLVRVKPGSAEAWNLRAGVFARITEEYGGWRQSLAAGREAYGRARRLEPHLPWFSYRLALLERRIGNLVEARRLAAAAVETEPAFVRGWLLLARLRLDLGDVEGARLALGQAHAALKRGAPLMKSAYEAELLEAPVRQLRSLEHEIPSAL